MDSRAPYKHAANAQAWALGSQRTHGFVVRKVVWGYLLASYEARVDEEIRRATIMVEAFYKPRTCRKVP